MTTRKAGPVAQALLEALRYAPVGPEDTATVELARSYAVQVDADPDLLPKVGPLLLAVLVELGMTPRARAGVLKGGQHDGGKRSELDELRHRRENRTAAVDSSAP